jgi:hypothetical protein
MACKEDRFECGNRVYLIRQMPPRLAVPMEVYLAKTLGQPMFKAFSTAELSSEGAMALAVGLFTERLDDAQLLKMMQTAFRFVGIKDVIIRICEENDGGEGLDTHFVGRNRELWQVFIKVLQVNFADFFVGALSPSSLFAKLRATILPKQSTSTSSSGDPASATPFSAETSTS